MALIIAALDVLKMKSKEIWSLKKKPKHVILISKNQCVDLLRSSDDKDRMSCWSESVTAHNITAAEQGDSFVLNLSINNEFFLMSKYFLLVFIYF